MNMKLKNVVDALKAQRSSTQTRRPEAPWNQESNCALGDTSDVEFLVRLLDEPRIPEAVRMAAYYTREPLDVTSWLTNDGRLEVGDSRSRRSYLTLMESSPQNRLAANMFVKCVRDHMKALVPA